nr:unnamed protein product [Callosobruchus analis]
MVDAAVLEKLEAGYKN